ncbi:MAG: sensor histidine kinase [Chloroflexi bacterium]|nr:MAG: sensor histidine kinase [Chloroflexota bacterium]
MTVERNTMRNLFHQKLDPDIKAEIKETRPFLLILIAVLIFLYGFALSSTPELRQPNRLIPITLLMLLHGALHWYVAYLTTRQTHLVLYLTVQILIVIALTFITRQEAIIMGLYLALAGETVGILADWRRSLIAAIGYLCLMALSFGIFWGWATAPQWIGTLVIMLLFVLVYVVLFMRQLLARDRAQQLLKELQTAHNQLADYSQRVETLTLETERQRMARELHDTLAQGLTGLVLQLEAMEAHLEKGNPDEAYQIVGQARDRARITLADARRAIDDLRTAETMPIKAITREAERFSTATGIPCQLTLPSSLPLSKQCSEHAVRFVTEGLANVTRHAQATEVWVTVEVENGRIHLQIRDNGIGFDNSNGTIPTGHYGLLGLRERARLANGTLTIDTAPGEGTVLKMEIPADSDQ